MNRQDLEQKISEYLASGKRIEEVPINKRTVTNPNRGFTINYLGQQERVRYERERMAFTKTNVS